MEYTEEIEKICKDLNIPMTGRIPFDKIVVDAANKRISIVDIDCPAGNAIKEVYRNTMKIFKTKSGDTE